jgi:hypothetical protein
MSEENVEIVRAATKAMIRGDARAALEALDPEITWHATVGGVDEGRVYRGREEVAQAHEPPALARGRVGSWDRRLLLSMQSRVREHRSTADLVTFFGLAKGTRQMARSSGIAGTSRHTPRFRRGG